MSVSVAATAAAAAATLQPFAAAAAVPYDKISQWKMREVVKIVMAVAAGAALLLVQQCVDTAEAGDWQQRVGCQAVCGGMEKA